jgi:hypothetical protein
VEKTSRIRSRDPVASGVKCGPHGGMKCEELDVLRVEVAVLKSRPALLGACTSCPVLHGKINEMHAYIVSLEAELKEPISTSCSTCELHALKNLDLHIMLIVCRMRMMS